MAVGITIVDFTLKVSGLGSNVDASSTSRCRSAEGTKGTSDAARSSIEGPEAAWRSRGGRRLSLV